MTPSGTSQATAMDQLRARDAYTAVIRRAKASGDTIAYSRVQEHREELLDATAGAHSAVESNPRSLQHTAALIRSRHPGRAQENVNPARIAAAAQPAIRQGFMTEEQVQLLVDIAQSGVRLAEFRELEGAVLDLSRGNTEEPLDHVELLNFYYEQAFLGRVLMFPAEKAEALDTTGELVLSPSFLVKVLGKKPRSILNLSSTDCGVNQRLHELMPHLVASAEGYSTVPDIALMLVEAFVAMVTRPQDFDIEDILGIRLGMTVMDGDAAFFRWPVAAEVVGVEATRVAGVTIVALCCVFGAEMSAINFSFVTAAIQALHKSDLDSAGFLRHAVGANEDLHPALRALHEEVMPEHSHLSRGHVDDFAAVEILSGLRPRASAMDLAWAIQVFLGTDGLSLKKWNASTFWSDLQKVIGAWFDVATFSVAMPRDKLEAALLMLEAPEFASDKVAFSINLCASLEGKLRWATLATPLGSTGALIGICKQRRVNESGDREARPWRYHGESRELSLAKFHNELTVRRVFLRAALADPSLASCSMLAMLKVADRLRVPGESAMLVWLSGDFSLQGQSFGVELLHPELGYVRRYCFMPHPAAVVAALREALAGRSESRGYAIVSSVCERQNKLMAEQQWRSWLADRPCIVLEDNTGSVACFNSGYSSNVIMQSMQLASNLRQAMDGARAWATYCTSKNMSWHDEVSRDPVGPYIQWANERLVQHDMVPWEREEPCQEVHAISEWLPKALESHLPLLDELLAGLAPGVRVPRMPSHGLDPAAIARPAELSWQRRVRAAARDMSCKLGSFGPNAYDVSHLEQAEAVGSTPLPSYRQLVQLNGQPAPSAYRVADLLWGGGCAAVSVIALGARVVATMGLRGADEAVARELTGAKNFTRGDLHGIRSLPSAEVLLAPLGDPAFLKLAGDAGVALIILEGPDVVFSLQGAGMLAAVVAEASLAGYGRLVHGRAVHAKYGLPTDGQRRVLMAVHDSVELQGTLTLPEESQVRACMGDLLLPSTLVPARCWDERPWARFPRQARSPGAKVRGMGYVGTVQEMQSPQQHRRVLHPSGLYPSGLAASGAGVVRTLRLRAMCPLRMALVAWATPRGLSAGGRSRAGGACNRSVLPSEAFAMAGLPADFGAGLNEEEASEMAARAIPLQFLTALLSSGLTHLAQAGVCGAREAVHAQGLPTARSTRSVARAERQRLAAAAAPSDGGLTGVRNGGVKSRQGRSLFNDLNREQLASRPLASDELLAMSMLQEALRYKHLEASKKQIDMSVRHWRSFCRRFKRPVHLRCGSLDLDRAAAAQAELFILYELANFDIKASSVVEKLWAVGKEHEAFRMQDPFKGNDVVRMVARDVCKLDGPPMPKIPVTDSTLQRISDLLDFSRRESWVLWTGIRVAIAFLCRISEWGFGGKHALRWYAVRFFDSDRNEILVSSMSDLVRLFEVELTFFDDKTHNFGEGTCRSFFAIPDQGDDRCVVRDLARVWLLSERNLEHHVFAWANDTEGPTRAQVSDLLKAAAVNDGIPEADISTHSLRVTGLSRLLAAKMDYESARTFGRWKSDCARRYWWPATSLAQSFAASIWDNPTFARVRGGGAVQYL